MRNISSITFSNTTIRVYHLLFALPNFIVDLNFILPSFQSYIAIPNGRIFWIQTWNSFRVHSHSSSFTPPFVFRPTVQFISVSERKSPPDQLARLTQIANKKPSTVFSVHCIVDRTFDRQKTAYWLTCRPHAKNAKNICWPPIAIDRQTHQRLFELQYSTDETILFSIISMNTRSFTKNAGHNAWNSLSVQQHTPNNIPSLQDTVNNDGIFQPDFLNIDF